MVEEIAKQVKQQFFDAEYISSYESPPQQLNIFDILTENT